MHLRPPLKTVSCCLSRGLFQSVSLIFFHFMSCLIFVIHNTSRAKQEHRSEVQSSYEIGAQTVTMMHQG